MLAKILIFITVAYLSHLVWRNTRIAYRNECTRKITDKKEYVQYANLILLTNIVITALIISAIIW